MNLLMVTPIDRSLMLNTRAQAEQLVIALEKAEQRALQCKENSQATYYKLQGDTAQNALNTFLAEA